MRGVWHKSRNFSVHHIVLRPGTPETVAVSVPSFGDSFFILSPLLIPQELQQLVSVPSFGDSFFIAVAILVNGTRSTCVSVPSFGDSFFILIKAS